MAEDKKGDMTCEHHAKSTPDKYDDVVLQRQQLGVYRLVLATTKNKHRRLLNEIQRIRDSGPQLSRLFKDIYGLSPRLFALVILAKAVTGLEDAMHVYLSTKLLRAIETGLSSDTPFAMDVMWALSLRVGYAALAECFSWLSHRFEDRLMTLVTSHFDLSLMRVKLRLDVPASLDASSQIDVSGYDAWGAFKEVVKFFTSILTIFSQILVVVQESRTSGDPIFLLACLAQPVLAKVFDRTLWDKDGYTYVDNEDFKRMRSLTQLADGHYREDVLHNDLAPWVLREYKTTSDRLGDIPQSHPHYQYFYAQSPLTKILQNVSGELPMVYCALSVISDPHRFSLASVAIYQTSTSTLQSTLGTLLRRDEDFWKDINKVKQIYSTADIPNQIVGGNLPYPSSEKGDEGMSFELRDVSFTYPSSRTVKGALDKVNLKIPAGSLVVIVGANGSGKSTLIRLLARLYDPTSGDFLIDGHPAKDYEMTDLRRASTILSQDNRIYPLSLAENIGLGLYESSDDMNLITKAAEQGGAAGFISKLQAGYETRLHDSAEKSVLNVHGKTDHPLYKEMEKLEKPASLSGGERQRLVAARSFMRFNSGKVKFVAVDEPSSALDADGELQLFNRLLESRDGKTMIFVTHRFGHLTKHADIIICMQDGKIVEQGKHEALIKNDGEYSKLYNIQASAFVADIEPESDWESESDN